MNKRNGMPMGISLAILSVGSVLLVAFGLFPMALRLMARLAEENAQTRVELAAWGEWQRLEERLAAASHAAVLLAERPTLNRLLAEERHEDLVDYLERYLASSGLEGCGLGAQGQSYWGVPTASFARFGDAIASVADVSGYGVVGGQLVVLAFAMPKDHPNQRVLVVQSLSSSPTSNHPVEIRLRLLTEPVTTKPESEFFSSRLKLGQGQAWVEASLERGAVARSIDPMRIRFLWITVGASLLVAAMGLAMGRWMVRPLLSLGRAALQIGSGDLRTQVRAVPGLETGALAATMEQMRRQLQQLTETLRQRESEAKAILTGIVEGVFSVDENRNLLYLNQQAAAMLGISEGEALGRFCGDVLRPQANGQRPCEYQCPIVHARSRGSSRAVELLQLPSGLRTVVVTSSPPGGTTQVQVMRDETEIETARRARDAILAHISHEFKTPLSAQLASIELLRDGLERISPADSAAMVEAMERSVHRLMQLIDNLLESVRIETGTVTSRSVEVELDVVLEDAVAVTLPLFSQRQQRLELPTTHLPQIWGDPQQLTQVLVNLLANAHKFSPDHSLIRVRAETAGDWVSLFVEDQGPGIQAAGSDSLFDRFKRQSPTTKGMGLGLWIVKEIVTRHGGSVRVFTSTLGGACFEVILSLEARLP